MMITLESSFVGFYRRDLAHESAICDDRSKGAVVAEHFHLFRFLHSRRFKVLLVCRLWFRLKFFSIRLGIDIAKVHDDGSGKWFC